MKGHGITCIHPNETVEGRTLVHAYTQEVADVASGWLTETKNYGVYPHRKGYQG